jgi:hypothetical protein
MIKNTGNFKIGFTNSHTIYENVIKCRVKEREFNLTLNPTTLFDKKMGDGVISKEFVSSTFEPYVTGIGLYNNKKELLMVCKIQQPIPLSKTSDMVFEIRYDI